MAQEAPSSHVLDVSALLSAEARRLTGASLSSLVSQFAGVPDIVALHTGVVPPASFPLSGLHLDLVPTSSLATQEAWPDRVDLTDRSSVVAAQQYEFGPGNPRLLDWIQRTMVEAHAPPASGGFQVAVTSGAVHALSLACCMLLEPGEWLLCDEYTYSHAIEVVFGPKGVRPLPVRMDAEGMDPDHLAQQVAWATEQLSQPGPGRAQQGSATTLGGAAALDLPAPRRPPRVVYLIPTGHNPTGITISLARRRHLYEVCRQLDLLIIEDDAYWWLYWGDAPPSRTPPEAPRAHLGWRPEAHAAPAPAPGASKEPGHTPEPGGARPPLGAAWHLELPKSLLSMDMDGRVLRVDTLAKVLGPGFRVGWVTGPPALVSKLALAAQASSVGASPLVQVAVAQLLHNWGAAGFDAHLRRLRALYHHKARVLEAAVCQHLAGRASWRGVPGAGMFMWLQWAPASGDGAAGPNDAALANALKEAHVVAVPGAICWADVAAAKAGKPCPFLRLNFAYLEPEQLEEGVVRLAHALVQCTRAGPT